MKEIEEIKKQISELQSKVAKLEKESKKEKKHWRARINDSYFYINYLGYADSCHETNAEVDNYRYKTRNYFKTKEEAEEHQDIINTYYDLMDLADELNNGEKIDWNDGTQCKYFIYYDWEVDTLERTCAFGWKYLGQTYCLDKNFKEKAIEKIGKDKLIKLFTYERS